MNDVIARIISQTGKCEAGHKVGDEFLMGQHTPPGMCAWAYHTLFPFAQVLQFGGTFPWEKDSDTAVVPCPDPMNITIFELRRVKPSKK
jgi:uncharacterized repeat protein (TIGR04076 family)